MLRNSKSLTRAVLSQTELDCNSLDLLQAEKLKIPHKNTS